MKTYLIPIKTISEANCSEPWPKKHKRHRRQRNFIRLYVPTMPLGPSEMVSVTLTRLSPKQLDSDNLVISLKWIRDAVADRLVPGLKPGHADSDPRITWHYAQRKHPKYAVEISII